ncbi:GGDEF and EAL domain-containing protein [uncultured Cohaesibacter sp.]|uniref:GGDEF and EAL domain-containing protein n=1 Tax=uncultured Cohaesibacter sp. TaxID=1002546 RepID=UPI0029312A6F|nr:GGDEF and EAL domain-containing protein [uncultured Cohaesibacter sp.]
MADNARDILTSIGEVVYEWHASGDRLRWSNNAFDVLQTDIISVFPSGKAYTDFITPDTLTSRYRSIFGSGKSDEGQGVPFECIYCLAPLGFENELRLWVEENGRWFAGEDGRAERVHGVVRVVNEQQHREQRLRFLSQFDELTGLFNRSIFFDQLQQTLDEVAGAGKHACFIVAHIDNFRIVNEAYGFDVADQVVKEIAKRISRRLRDGDLVGRISGTKFGLLINNCSEKEMEAAAERFLDAAREELIITDAGPVHVTLSMGGVYLGEEVRDLRTAEICALDALDHATHHNRGTFRSFHAKPFALEERQKKIRMADEVITALNERRIELAFQPIVEAKSGDVVLHEVLVRIDDRDGAPIPAVEFIDFAEQLGLAAMLDHRILEMTLDLLFTYSDARLSINVSPEIGTDKEWMAYLRARIANFPDVAERLMIEISEAAILDNLSVATDFVASLHELGAKVAIDDFGAGHTSFQNLKQVKADMVKIAGSLMLDIAQNSQNRAIVRMFAELAKELGFDVVAKWVVSSEIVDVLSPLDVTYLQGFHFGEPSKQLPFGDESEMVSVN